MGCIFCKIVTGESHFYKVWEDEKHIAFLSILPNTEGVTVAIPKQHYPSYAFDLPEQVSLDLVLAANKVGKLLDNKLEDVGKTAMLFEGFWVGYIHAKLFPTHGTKWKTGNLSNRISINILKSMKVIFILTIQIVQMMKNYQNSQKKRQTPV